MATEKNRKMFTKNEFITLVLFKLVTRNEKNQKLCFESQAIPKIVSSLAVEEDSMIKELLLSTLSNTLNVEPARKQFVDLHFYNVLYGLLSQEQETPGIKVQASYSLSNLLKLPDSMGHLEHLDFVPLLLDIIRNDKSDSTMEEMAVFAFLNCSRFPNSFPC